MSTSVRWFDSEHKIFLIAFEGRWTWEELYATIDDVHKLCDSVPHSTWGIVTLSNSVILPQFAISNFKRMIVNAPHARTQGFAIVVSNSFLQAIGKVLQNMMPKVAQSYYFTTTLELAVAWVEEQKRQETQVNAINAG